MGEELAGFIAQTWRPLLQRALVGDPVLRAMQRPDIHRHGECYQGNRLDHVVDTVSARPQTNKIDAAIHDTSMSIAICYKQHTSLR